MLKDVLFITKRVFDDALVNEETLRTPKKVYDIYRCLEDLISDINLVANHYLALDFTEAFLQSSSWGEPADKWRKFLNKDLEELNISAKKYLLSLSYLGHDNKAETYVSKIYSAKSYYGFVKDKYNIGFVEQNSKLLHLTTLQTNLNKVNDFYLSKDKKIDLSTYESRVELQNKLNNKKDLLVSELKKLKEYILNRYTINDLLVN